LAVLGGGQGRIVGTMRISISLSVSLLFAIFIATSVAGLPQNQNKKNGLKIL
jgi:hypothetical protein